MEFLSKNRPRDGPQKQLLAISLHPPIESSDNISPGSSSISIILQRSSNINLGYSLMCSIAGFSIFAVAYFCWEVSRNIGSRTDMRAAQSDLLQECSSIIYIKQLNYTLTSHNLSTTLSDNWFTDTNSPSPEPPKNLVNGQLRWVGSCQRRNLYTT